jgi:glutamine cyclotransferase
MAAPLSPADAPVYGYRVVREYPHDPSAFTQGLVYADGHLYESTGLKGASSLRQIDLETGRVIRRRALRPDEFGEGLTDWDGRLLQLTWTGMRGFIYERPSLAVCGTFRYAGEGWGLTHDGRRLILSDGTAMLRFLDPETFREIGRLPVHDEGRAVPRLNELEYVRGEVYANVWQSDRVARISPETGAVLGWIDLTGLLSAGDLSHPVDVLNGIAYDPGGERLFVTGKWWPKLFEIIVGPAPGPTASSPERPGIAGAPSRDVDF